MLPLPTLPKRKEKNRPKFQMYGKLDRLFATIPGKDNYRKVREEPLSQQAFGDVMYSLGGEWDDMTPLNTGYYHR